MVRLHLRVISILCGFVGRGHDSSVVGKAVKLGVLAFDLCCRFANALEVLKVAFHLCWHLVLQYSAQHIERKNSRHSFLCLVTSTYLPSGQMAFNWSMASETR